MQKDDIDITKDGDVVVEVKVNGKRFVPESIPEPKPKDPAIRYIESRSFDFPRKPEIAYIGEIEYLRIPLPKANKSWTWAAYEYAKDFCKEVGGYPVHSKDPNFDNSEYLYVHII